MILTATEYEIYSWFVTWIPYFAFVIFFGFFTGVLYEIAKRFAEKRSVERQ